MAKSLAEIRKDYPQYNDMSDDQFASAMHRRFYADMPRSEFDAKIGYKKDRAPSVGKQALDVGEHIVRGINKGMVGTLGLPYRGLDYLAERAGINDGKGLPDFDTLSLYRPFVNQPRPETTAGRVAQSAGEGVGMSVFPQAALTKAAPQLAQLAPTTTARAIGQTIGQQVSRTPAFAAGVDLASGASAGAGAQGAEESGFGPTGQMIAATAAGLVPGAALAYRYRGQQPQAGGPTAQSMARRRSDQAELDIGAGNRQGVRQFGPAYNEGPVASVAKQLSETPLIGAPVRRALEQSMEETAQASRRLANTIHPTATPESAGNRVLGGLDRYRSTGLEDLPPGQVQALGVNPTRPTPRYLRMGQRQRSEIQRAEQAAPLLGANQAQTTRGVNVPPAQQLGRVYTNRTDVGDLSDSQLTTVIRAPAEDTSFITRQEALFERAFRMLPDIPRADSSANPNMVPAVNTRSALGEIDQNIASNITQQNTIRGPLADRLRNARASNFQIGQLRAMRTEIGRALANFSPIAPASLDRGQLKRLYGAISNDLENGIATLWARAVNRSSLPGSNTRGPVPIEQARRAAGALRAYRTADRYTRQGMRRIETFYGMLNAKNGEQATSRLVRAALSGNRGDARLFRNAMAVLRPEERTEFASLVVRQMGQPGDGAKGVVQEIDWSPMQFVTKYRSMTDDAKYLLFTRSHRESLRDIFRLANRLANVENLTNWSRTGTNTINITGAVGSAASVASGDIFTPLLIGGSGASTAWMMARPRYAQFMAGYLRRKANFLEGTENTIGPLLNHISGLQRHTEINPALLPIIAALTDEVNAMAKERKKP